MVSHSDRKMQLQVFESFVLREMYGAKVEEVTGE